MSIYVQFIFYFHIVNAIYGTIDAMIRETILGTSKVYRGVGLEISRPGPPYGARPLNAFSECDLLLHDYLSAFTGAFDRSMQHHLM